MTSRLVLAFLPTALAALLFCGTPRSAAAAGAPQRVEVTGDNSIVLYPGEYHLNAGGQTRIRIKGNQHRCGIGAVDCMAPLFAFDGVAYASPCPVAGFYGIPPPL